MTLNIVRQILKTATEDFMLSTIVYHWLIRVIKASTYLILFVIHEGNFNLENRKVVY